MRALHRHLGTAISNTTNDVTRLRALKAATTLGANCSYDRLRAGHLETLLSKVRPLLAERFPGETRVAVR